MVPSPKVSNWNCQLNTRKPYSFVHSISLPLFHDIIVEVAEVGFTLSLEVALLQPASSHVKQCGCVMCSFPLLEFFFVFDVRMLANLKKTN